MSQALQMISIMTILIIKCVSVIKFKIGLCQNLMYGFVSPIAGLLISILFGFIIVNRRKNGTTSILTDESDSTLQARIGKTSHQFRFI